MTAHRVVVVPALVVALGLVGLLDARQNVVLNGSMELGPGKGGVDPQVPASWSEFGENVERSATVNLAPVDGGWALKAFGDPFGSSAGASQIIEGVVAGDQVTATVWLYTPSFDQLGGTGQAGLVLEFLDFFGGTISLQNVPDGLTAASPADTWVPVTIGPLSAPSGTQEIRVSCRMSWSPPDVSGAAYWDDVQVTVNGGADLVVNGDFETAGTSPGQSTVGLDEWQGFNDQEKSDLFALDGTSSLQLGVREAYNGLYQNMTELLPNEQIRLRAWVLNSPTDPLEETARAGIKLEFDPAANVPSPEENLAFSTADPLGTWTQVELQTVVPPDVTLARIVVISNPDPAETGVLYFDDVHAGATTDPLDNLLANASFETGTPDNWEPFGDAAKDCLSVFRTGVCSTLTQGDAVAGMFQEVPVTPGQDLYISAWVLTPNFNPITAAATTAGVKVEWAVGGVPGDIDLGAQNNEIDATATPGVWIPLTIDYTMGPDEGALARFTNLSIKNVAQDGYAYFDACEAVVLNRYDGSDVDGDDDQDLLDAVWLQRSYTGSGAGALPFNGITFDHDDDLDVDGADFGYFETRMTGPGA